MAKSSTTLIKLLASLALLPCTVLAGELRTEYGGHTKVSLRGQSWPDNSLLRDLIGQNSLDLQGDLRLNLELRRDRWSFDANYQLVGLGGDQFELFSQVPVTTPTLLASLPDDERRLLDLTTVIDSGSRAALLHRLDRLWIGYTTENTVLRVGRQALSWGNGLFYAPMDLVNPFDPAAVDKEYKPGDDMVYLQYLRESGADIQAAYVARRSLSNGDVESDAATAAVKYHGFVGAGEFDLLLASHYGDPVIGIGLSRGFGGAQWGADVVMTDSDSDIVTQLSTNVSYSWVAFDKNMSGTVEYHYNGFGQSDSRYSPAALAGNAELLRRVSRGDSFTLGRHYLAAAVTVEVTPLWNLSPTLFANVADPSALLQINSNFSLGDNSTLLASLSLPIGPSGSEFGGVDTGVQDRYLSSGLGAFLQVAWYF